MGYIFYKILLWANMESNILEPRKSLINFHFKLQPLFVGCKSVDLGGGPVTDIHVLRESLFKAIS